MLSSALLSAPAAQIPATAAPRSWLADDPPFTFAFDVVVLTSTRTALLRLVLASVARHVSRCDPRVLIAEAGEYYELRGGGS